jgi:hypothetical protein
MPSPGGCSCRELETLVPTARQLDVRRPTLGVTHLGHLPDPGPAAKPAPLIAQPPPRTRRGAAQEGEAMRNPLKFALIAALLLFVGATAVMYQKYQKSNTAFTALKAEDEDTRGRYAAAIGSIATIQDSLNAIVLGEDAARLTPTGYELERTLSQSQGDQVLAKIGVLRAGIERSKARIQELDQNLKKSGMQIQGLEQMMASLKRTVAKKEAMIAQLTQQVESLHTQVNGLTVSVEEKRQELGTVFVIMGSKKELVSAGAVVSTGGVLGIGKTLKPTGHVDESMCITVDTDQASTVDIPAKDALVVSAQPATSYALEPVGDHTLLRILDPKEFRKVRHVVIVTKTA